MAEKTRGGLEVLKMPDDVELIEMTFGEFLFWEYAVAVYMHGGRNIYEAARLANGVVLASRSLSN